MSRSRVQGAFRTAKCRAGITKLGVAIHTLRNASTYCYTSLIDIDFKWLALRGRATPSQHGIQCTAGGLSEP
jgi:hypothetical protein